MEWPFEVMVSLTGCPRSTASMERNSGCMPFSPVPRFTERMGSAASTSCTVASVSRSARAGVAIAERAGQVTLVGQPEPEREARVGDWRLDRHGGVRPMLVESMSIRAALQPDQDPSRWDGHADAYERVFEPLTVAFAGQTLDRLEPLSGLDLLDVAAGAGGTALEALRRGARVTAVDASAAMVRRIAARAPGVAAHQMDGAALAFRTGVRRRHLLFRRRAVPRPGHGHGRAAPRAAPRRPGRRCHLDRAAPLCPGRPPYEAIIAVRGAPPPAGELPAQLRFVDPDWLRALVADAGFGDISIVPLVAELHAASAAELAASLGFAPGMQALLDALGPDCPAVLQEFAGRLAADQGAGPVSLGAVAHAALAVRR